MNPCPAPNSVSRTTKARMTQSTPVTGRASLAPHGAGNARCMDYPGRSVEGAVRRPAPYAPRARRSPADERRRARRRAIPVIAIALVAFVAGLIAGAGHGSSERAVAQRFADAWQ